MKSTHPQLHKTSKIIEKLHLSKKLSQSEKMIIFLMEIVCFRVDLRSDNDLCVSIGCIVILRVFSLFSHAVVQATALPAPQAAQQGLAARNSAAR